MITKKTIVLISICVWSACFAMQQPETRFLTRIVNFSNSELTANIITGTEIFRYIIAKGDELVLPETISFDSIIRILLVWAQDGQRARTEFKQAALQSYAQNKGNQLAFIFKINRDTKKASIDIMPDKQLSIPTKMVSEPLASTPPIQPTITPPAPAPTQEPIITSIQFEPVSSDALARLNIPSLKPVSLPLLASRGLKPLPEKFSKLPIYYLNTPCISGISCGYYTLYNAIQLQRARFNQPIDLPLAEFQKECARGAGVLQERLIEGTTYEQRKNIGSQYSLAPMIQLHVKGNTVDLRPDFMRLEEAKLISAFTDWGRLIHGFRTGMFDSYNFFATFYINGVPHVILMSPVRHQDGSVALYIFDNCNVPVEKFPEVEAYISALTSFVRPYIPEELPKVLDEAIQIGNEKLLTYLLKDSFVQAQIKKPGNYYLEKALQSPRYSINNIKRLLAAGVALEGNPALAIWDYIPSDEQLTAIELLICQFKINPFITTRSAGAVAESRSLMNQLIENESNEKSKQLITTIYNCLPPALKKEFDRLREQQEAGISIASMIEKRLIDLYSLQYDRELILQAKNINTLDGMEQISSKKISKINLELNKIKEVKADHFQNIPYLNRLNLGYNAIASFDPKTLAKSEYDDIELILTKNKLKYIDPVILEKVKYIDLRQNPLTEENKKQLQEKAAALVGKKSVELLLD